KPGIGIRCRCHPTDDPALHDAAAKTNLYGRDPGQASCRRGGPAPGARHRGQRFADKATVVETGRVARAADTRLFPTADILGNPFFTTHQIVEDGETLVMPPP